MLLQTAIFHSFLWMSNVPLYVYKHTHTDTYIPFVLYPFTGHLGCFCILAIVDNAALNIGVYISFQITVFVFFKYIPRSGNPGSCDSYIFNFLRILHTVFYRGCTSLHQNTLEFAFLHIFANICYLW